MRCTTLRSLALALALASCTGSEGPAGTDGTSGAGKWVLVGNPSNGDYPGAIIRGVSGNYLLATSAFGISRSSDNGATWAPTGFPDTHFVRALTVSGGKIYAGGCPVKATADESCGIYVSSDNGASFAPTGFRGTSEIRGLAVYGDQILAGLAPGLARSTDHGATWTPMELPTDSPVTNAVATSGSTILAGGADGMYLSSDNGQTWKHPLAEQCFTTTAIAVVQANILAACISGLYRSSDNGATWTRIFAGKVVTFSTVGQSICVGMALEAMAGAGGVACSLDNGATWTQAGEGLPGITCSSVLAANDYLFATDYWGNVWRLPLSAL
jgi:hypothetical protein